MRRACKIFTLLAGCRCLVISPSAHVRAAKKKQAASSPSGCAAYVGTAACSRCHLVIANIFRAASMGHSLTLITPDLIKTLPLTSRRALRLSIRNTVMTFNVHAEDGKLYPDRIQNGQRAGDLPQYACDGVDYRHR
jgi:hypothetical protein